MTDTQPSPSGPKPGSGEFKTPAYLAQFFESLQDAQIESQRQLTLHTAEIEQLKTLLAVHGRNSNETIERAKELFDLRTTMVTSDYDRITAQFREVSAVFQTSIERLNDSIDERFLRFERKLDTIHREDSTIQAARITRSQVVAVGIISA